MALSLMVHGQIEPIVVTGPDENGKYRGVVGRLRYEGMKKRWENEPEGKTILARVHKFEDELEIKMWQLAENLHRRQLPPMQKAKQLKALHDLIRKEAGEEATIQTLAAAIEDMTGEKESVKTVQHYLSLTKLQPEVQEILTRENAPLRHGLELLRVKNPEKQVDLARRAAEEGWSLSDLKWKVDEVTAEERRKRRDEQLKKKAEELEKETGKKVYVDRLISWEERERNASSARRRGSFSRRTSTRRLYASIRSAGRRSGRNSGSVRWKNGRRGRRRLRMRGRRSGTLKNSIFVTGD